MKQRRQHQKSGAILTHLCFQLLYGLSLWHVQSFSFFPAPFLQSKDADVLKRRRPFSSFHSQIFSVPSSSESSDGFTDQILAVDEKNDRSSIFQPINSTRSTVSSRQKSFDWKVTPYQILFPDLFNDEESGIDRKLPLARVLELFRQALQAMQDGSWWQTQQERLRRPNSNPRRPVILRMEHVLSHAVDPLAWLDAQLKRQYDDASPAFYLASQEGDVEVACLESALTVHETSNVWEYWHDLPTSSRFYGGARFDLTDTAASMGDEWKAFGAAWWMLPAIELRREGNNQSTLALHIVMTFDQDIHHEAWFTVAAQRLALLNRLSDDLSSRRPPTTLPPILSRDSNYGILDGQELYEQSVSQALKAFDEGKLEKVVLARRQQIQLSPSTGVSCRRWTALQVIQRWKYSLCHEGGHLFWMRVPPFSGSSMDSSSEFFGCTPERLMQIRHGEVRSEALAGTRPRGTTQEADKVLLRDLFASPKDRRENRLTGKFIDQKFQRLKRTGWIDYESPKDDNDGVFVRRLLHLQHICQSFKARLTGGEDQKMNVARFLFEELHPTPAMCGLPFQASLDFIRDHEKIGFDRGFYSGPIGYIGRSATDVLVGIRSALVTHTKSSETTISVYAGAGVVPGSEVHSEWAEINYKLGVIASLFPQSPMTLQSAPTPNVAWTTAFVEELIRNGVTQFYICPGSRSTPLVVAIARASRAHLGIVKATSVHDERAAGFRALGYARGAGRPAAVVTSSGTAVANLYPSIVEAGLDAVPMLLLTADRPYENRHSGANQAIDQVKVFSSSYIRWFRDILPPDDEVPVTVALSDAAHAVRTSRNQRGPVHLNIQFRENLAPDAGPIRNDARVDSLTRFNADRFTDAPSFLRWSVTGDQFTRTYRSNDLAEHTAIYEISRLIAGSKRGIIVVGNLREYSSEGEDFAETIDTISNFAQSIGFPIFAGVQSATLRFRSAAVVPFAEHLLKSPLVADNLQPDLILQLGAPLVSTAIPGLIESAMKKSKGRIDHILVHAHANDERVDPLFSVNHAVSSPVGPFLKGLMSELERDDLLETQCGSDLAPILHLARMLQSEMKTIIENAAAKAMAGNKEQRLTEPEIIVALAEHYENSNAEQALFLSNSMPIRDSEFFLYPFGGERFGSGPKRVGSNRGASGIDGIIASATGFADSTKLPTTLIIGDLSTLHDVNSFHALARIEKGPGNAIKRISNPLTTVVVNNNGGGIFSFLPIARHGDDVAFDEFFGTPTQSFSYEAGAKAFGLAVQKVSDIGAFRSAYDESSRSSNHSVIEAVVASRHINVEVHREISTSVVSLINDLLTSQSVERSKHRRVPMKLYSRQGLSDDWSGQKTLVLIHGWMGDKHEWDGVAAQLQDTLDSRWRILSVDLPGHGDSEQSISQLHAVQASLGISADSDAYPYSQLSVDSMAEAVLSSLREDYRVKRIDALAGYSLGGRVALAMKRRSVSAEFDTMWKGLIVPETRVALVSAYPGELAPQNEADTNGKDQLRLERDRVTATEIAALAAKSALRHSHLTEEKLLWGRFLRKWYSSPIWGNLQKSDSFDSMMTKRAQALSSRGRDLGACLLQSSPPNCQKNDWQSCSNATTLFIAGELDTKYSEIGRFWAEREGIRFNIVPSAGHSLLFERPDHVSKILGEFFKKDDVCPSSDLANVKHSIASVDSAESFNKTVESTSTMRQKIIEPKVKISSTETALVRGTGDQSSPFDVALGSLSFEDFSFDLVDETRKAKPLAGVGWGESAKPTSSRSERKGFIIQLQARDALEAGIGEVSPLRGLHQETMEDVNTQLHQIQIALQEKNDIPPFDFSRILSMDGSLQKYIDQLMNICEIERCFPSVRSGLEMAVLSLASQRAGMPIHAALADHFLLGSQQPGLLSTNGLVTRAAPKQNRISENERIFPSLKVKVGGSSLVDDIRAMAIAFHQTRTRRSGTPSRSGRVRADANRAWNESQAIEFVLALEGIELRSLDRLEYVEEPLQVQQEKGGISSTEAHVEALERWYRHTGAKYALDETLADLVDESGYNFERVQERLSSMFATGQRGCAAFVLKPAVLGLEMSLRLARLARAELGVGAVFSSSFDSGVGLAYTSFLAALSDTIESTASVFPHGVGTFTLIGADTIQPPFASYVNDAGVLNVPSLSRAFYGLCLNEIRDTMPRQAAPSFSPDGFYESESYNTADDESFEASTATSSSGNEISVVASLSLPFSAEIACNRFTDLPQQSRWSPWISSVAYQGKETEWTLNVKGIPLRWRAISQILTDPHPGIQWESVSGLENRGTVEFIPDKDKASCTMTVKMTILRPRLLRSVFKGASVFLEDYLRDKLLKWSLEMFRDAVKADLALERGDVELGDALYGSVQGKASAIEATLGSNEIGSKDRSSSRDADDDDDDDNDGIVEG